MEDSRSVGGFMECDRFQYAAFISYSHADENWAKWLHQRLERYRVPSRLVGRQTVQGTVARRIGRCFRDQNELSAGSDLGEILKEALRNSRFLIAVCSPRAATSHWVNEEIKYFRALGRGDRVYTLIVDGEPNAKVSEQECFPPALLRADDGSVVDEPLAADARESADGKSDGFLKLIAGILGVGFDELRRRERRRRVRLMVMAVAASLAIAATTTLLAINANMARNEAQQRRQQADDLITFMLGDLKSQLERVGRLDVLDTTINKAISYLGAADPASLNNLEIAHRVGALAAVTEVRYARGDVKTAVSKGKEAISLARVLRQRNPGPDSDVLLATAIDSYVEPALDNGDFVSPAPLIEEALALIDGLPASVANSERLILLTVALLESQSYIDSNGPKLDLPRSLVSDQHALALINPLYLRPEASAAVITARMRYLQHYAVNLYRASQFEDSLQAWQQFSDDTEMARRQYPSDRPLLFVLQAGMSNAVKVFSRLGALDDGLRASARSIELGRSLVAFEPDYADGAIQFVRVLTASSELHMRMEDWDAAAKNHKEGFEVIKRWLEIPVATDTARGAAISLYQQAADLSLKSRGDRESALAYIEQGLALQKASGHSSHVQLLLLRLHWRHWFVVHKIHPQRINDSRAKTVALIERLRPQVTPELLQHAQAAVAYLVGHIAEGDRLYVLLKTRGDPLLSELDPVRTLACSEHGVNCPPL